MEVLTKGFIYLQCKTNDNIIYITELTDYVVGICKKIKATF